MYMFPMVGFVHFLSLRANQPLVEAIFYLIEFHLRKKELNYLWKFINKFWYI